MKKEDRRKKPSKPMLDPGRYLDELTLPKFWEYDRFRQILIALGMLRRNNASPTTQPITILGRNRPDTIHIGRLKTRIDDLRSRTKETGKEHAVCLFADWEKRSLVSGRMTIGSDTQVRVDDQAESGRAMFQTPVVSIHTHPGLDLCHGFSGQDYRIFLGDSRLQGMMICFGDFDLIFAMKTSVTPNDHTSQEIDSRIKIIEHDYLRCSQFDIKSLVDFNRAVCTEMGLVMYTTMRNPKDVLHRVEVTRL